jgi:hypothetical protein
MNSIFEHAIRRCNFLTSTATNNKNWLSAFRNSASGCFLALTSNRVTILGPREKKVGLPWYRAQQTACWIGEKWSVQRAWVIVGGIANTWPGDAAVHYICIRVPQKTALYVFITNLHQRFVNWMLINRQTNNQLIDKQNKSPSLNYQIM